jgi:hypothetical protein
LVSLRCPYTRVALPIVSRKQVETPVTIVIEKKGNRNAGAITLAGMSMVSSSPQSGL